MRCESRLQQRNSSSELAQDEASKQAYIRCRRGISAADEDVRPLAPADLSQGSRRTGLCSDAVVSCSGKVMVCYKSVNQFYSDHVVVKRNCSYDCNRDLGSSTPGKAPTLSSYTPDLQVQSLLKQAFPACLSSHFLPPLQYRPHSQPQKSFGSSPPHLTRHAMHSPLHLRLLYLRPPPQQQLVPAF